MTKNSITDLIGSRSIQGSAAAGIVLGAASIVRPLPWWLWAIWTVLTVASVGQAVRDCEA